MRSASLSRTRYGMWGARFGTLFYTVVHDRLDFWIGPLGRRLCWPNSLQSSCVVSEAIYSDNLIQLHYSLDNNRKELNSYFSWRFPCATWTLAGIFPVLDLPTGRYLWLLVDFDG